MANTSNKGFYKPFDEIEATIAHIRAKADELDESYVNVLQKTYVEIAEKSGAPRVQKLADSLDVLIKDHVNPMMDIYRTYADLVDKKVAQGKAIMGVQ